MVHPNSRFIDKIEYSNLKFLTGTNSVSSQITNSYFNTITGKPLTNLTLNTKVDNFFLDTVKNSLFERKNISESFVYKYPKVLETNAFRDIQVTNETTIDAVFIMEGASMLNMVGYYMYSIDGDAKRILANDGSSSYHYDATVIFPHVLSEDGNSNTLQQGHSRRLKGNLPNGNFANIYIGFFLVPHGWYVYKTDGLIDNDDIIYSTVDFNIKNSESEYGMITDKIYSVFVKAKSTNNDELLLVGFEDMPRSKESDLDYNDAVIGFEISEVLNIVDFDKYCDVEVEEEEITESNNIVCIDDDGEYIRFKDREYVLPINKHILVERHMCFDNQVDRDEMDNIYKDLLTNYKLSVDKDIEGGFHKLICKYLFRKNDISGAERKNNEKQIYIFESKYNRHKQDIMIRCKEQVSKNLANNNYSEKYKVYPLNDSYERDGPEIISLTDTIEKNKIKETNAVFRIIGNGIMSCKQGKARLPHQNKQIYTVYSTMDNNLGITINVKMDDHPVNYMLGIKNFVRWISFNVDNSGTAVIDLKNLDIYEIVNGNLVKNNSATFSKISVSGILTEDTGIKDMMKLFKSDSGTFYRKVVLKGGMTIFCVRMPIMKNNPTAVFARSDTLLKWNEKYVEKGGTYFNKHELYPVDNF